MLLQSSKYITSNHISVYVHNSYVIKVAAKECKSFNGPLTKEDFKEELLEVLRATKQRARKSLKKKQNSSSSSSSSEDTDSKSSDSDKSRREDESTDED